MKKAILLSFVFILLFGCAYTKKEEASKDRVTTIEEIDYDSLVEKLGQNEDFLLYIGRPDCGDCKEFYPDGTTNPEGKKRRTSMKSVNEYCRFAA